MTKMAIGEAAPPSEADDQVWLEFLVRADPGNLMNEAVTRRLRNMAFEQVISAAEQTPTPSHAGEIALYRAWIEANAGHGLAWAGWFNLGTLYARIADHGNAMIAYSNALVLRPDLACTAVNLGLLYEAAGQHDQALQTWQRATQPDESRMALETQRGRLCEKLGRLDEAEHLLRRVLMTDPTQPDVIHHFVHLRQKTCLWPVLTDDLPGLSPATLLEGSGPFGIMALTDNIALQCAAAARWVERKTNPAPHRLAPAAYAHDRIRIGYLSSDFCSHAMSYLITELFERHDRSRFEVFGYCSSLDDGSGLRQRVLGAFDQHRLVRTLSDEDAAKIIRNDEIDVLIELNGITDGSRLAVLRWRPAPIQATYLGFVGPVPLPELDYLLCDNVVIPPEHEHAYQPRPLVIGAVYQANDSKRSIGRHMRRAEAGLPDDGFVLCCFSKHYKITESVFAAWMRILAQVPHAVLWLAMDNMFSKANLLAAAARAGIAPGRIIISERADPDLYMSRLRLADLFLDTFPYNAGTVASDALRMELPMITLCGQAFASRMATSLLHAIGATEGVTTSLESYAALAIRLATDSEYYIRYRAKFTVQAWAQTLGNIARFTASLEDALERAVRRQALTPALNDIFARAMRLHTEGALAEAAPLYAEVLASPAAPALAHFGFGLLAASLNRPAEAATAYRRAIALQPDFADAYVNLGTLLLAQGHTDEAIALYNRALVLNPQNAMALGNRGKALQDSGRHDEALASYRAAIALQPEEPGAYINLGAALLAAEDWEASAAASHQAILHRPDSAMAYTNLGNALLHLGRYNEALAACRRALALQPEGALIKSSLGGAMLELGDFATAVTLCEDAIALDPSQPSAYFNLSHGYKALNRLDDAARAAHQAIALSPQFAQYHFHLAHILLLKGDLLAGWYEYEWRWQLPDFAWRQNLPQLAEAPLWTGADISSQTILVHTEQGLGDIIQFARFLLPLVQRAKHVIVAVQPPVRRLLASISGINLVSLRETLPEFDVQCPLLSLPRAFATTLASIPAPPSYLKPDDEAVMRWTAGLGLPRRRRGTIRVGIVWAGNPLTLRDRFRSPGLASVAPLFAVPGVEFLVLQAGPGREDIFAPLPPHVRDLGGAVEDLADTAAIMLGLDLMISSCTAPLHLAGALGVPCWGLIPFAPHFTWGLDRTDSLWYPSLRLYRQDQPGRDWSGVVTRMAADLTALAQIKPAATRRPAPADALS
jgi:predicted O-linked N-acetylglucosamine transferase (SPINDLY family)